MLHRSVTSQLKERFHTGLGPERIENGVGTRGEDHSRRVAKEGARGRHTLDVRKDNEMSRGLVNPFRVVNTHISLAHLKRGPEVLIMM
jgi:hypothetical protein